MPRYYFDVRDSAGDLLDELGEELPSDDAATFEAVKVAASIARDSMTADGSLRILVRKEQSRLLDVTLTITIDRVPSE